MFAAGQLYVSFRAWRSNLFKDISSRRSVIISFVTYVNGEMIFGLSYSLRYYYIFMVSKRVSYFYSNYTICRDLMEVTNCSK